MSGHVGIYVGDGMVAESTPRWEGQPHGVKLTVCHNVSNKAGVRGRKWTKHGKLPWVDYTEKVSDITNLDDVPDYAKEAISYFVEKGYLKGVADNDLGLNLDMVRILTVCYRVLKGELKWT